jgi:uncharacterized protein YprB with RNaseH-like and TPR domain
MAHAAENFSRLAALRPARPAASRPTSLRGPDETDDLAHLIGAGVAKNRYGEHLAVRNWFSAPEFTEASPIALDLLSRSRDEAVSRRTRAALEDPSRWLFLDTETTGLAGGTGTYAFLIGIAWWDAGGLQAEQFFMRDFSEEHSLLEELAARIAERPVLITFNGKSFDWPLLESRFTLTRAIPVPRLAAHLDMLHPARALWKLRLGSVRLVELERRVLDAPRLGWHRDNDVESARIPQFYFDYLRGGPAEPLAGVVRHNQMDLRGLAALLGKVSALLAAAEHTIESPDEALDLFGLSRYLHRRGERSRARSACQQALDSGLPAAFRPQASRELALHAARQGDHARAALLWEELLQHPGDALRACEHLAIHCERRARDLPRAADYTRLGLKKLCLLRSKPGNMLSAGHFVRLEEKFLRRLARLEHRISLGSRAALTPLLAPPSGSPGPTGRRVAT